MLNNSVSVMKITIITINITQYFFDNNNNNKILIIITPKGEESSAQNAHESNSEEHGLVQQVPSAQGDAVLVAGINDGVLMYLVACCLRRCSWYRSYQGWSWFHM